MSDRRAPGPGDAGQASVELALLLPFVAVLLLGVIQVALLAHRQVLVVHAAREAARAASVVDDPESARITARVAFARGADLDPAAVEVSTEVLERTVTVHARYRDPTDVPLVGLLLHDVELAASATMAREAAIVGGTSSGTVQSVGERAAP